ncbi:hypothetical protein [Methylorubrum sp. SB2]|uniref:hypothetical protein n=1 Tax=Methylorubrum subtropicum TaxID=3138812 RepID=UPI00313AEEB6
MRVLASGALLAMMFSPSAPASAQAFGNWTVGGGQGYVEYIVRSGPGNSFNISCDVGASLEGEEKKTSIFVEIVGRAPPPKSQVQVFLDGASVQLFADAQGLISTGCHSCSDNFAFLWAKARKSKQMIISLSDGRSATFQLNGAAKALTPKHCTTGFES